MIKSAEFHSEFSKKEVSTGNVDPGQSGSPWISSFYKETVVFIVLSFKLILSGL